MIAVYLKTKEAQQFINWRKYQKLWEKIFKTKLGSVELHFNQDGEIAEVKYHISEKLSTICKKNQNMLVSK